MAQLSSEGITITIRCDPSLTDRLCSLFRFCMSSQHTRVLFSNRELLSLGKLSSIHSPPEGVLLKGNWVVWQCFLGWACPTQCINKGKNEESSSERGVAHRDVTIAHNRHCNILLDMPTSNDGTGQVRLPVVIHATMALHRDLFQGCIRIRMRLPPWIWCNRHHPFLSDITHTIDHPSGSHLRTIGLCGRMGYVALWGSHR